MKIRGLVLIMVAVAFAFAPAKLNAQIKALTASVQKVSDQVELSKPARTVMVNDPGKN